MRNFTRCILIICALLFLNIKHIRSQNLEFARNFGGVFQDRGHDMVRDGQGNFLITGSFDGTADFDPTTGVFNLSAHGAGSVSNPDVFIAKYDTSGMLLWARSFGGNGADEGNFIDLDQNSNIYVVGKFSDTADFDPFSGVTSHVASVSGERFIAKYDAFGGLIWVRSFEFSDKMIVEDMEVASNGEIYLAGNYTDSVDFQPFQFIFEKRYTSGLFDKNGFLVKYSKFGLFSWMVEFDGSQENSCNSIFIKDSSEVYVTGHIDDSVDFDPDTGQFILGRDPIYQPDLFVAKYESNSKFVNAWTAGSNHYDRGSRIKILDGNIYLSGMYSTDVDFDFGSDTMYCAPAPNIYYYTDQFIAKYDMNMNVEWVNCAISTHLLDFEMTDFDIDAEKSVYVTGIFASNFIVATSDTTWSRSSQGLKDIFIAKFDKNGVAQWGKSIRSPANLWSSAIYANGVGLFYVYGHRRSFTDFDLSPDTHIVGNSSLHGDLFIVKYSPCEDYRVSYRDTFCYNGEYTFPDGLTVSWTTNHTSYFTNASGCDSLITVYAVKRSTPIGNSVQNKDGYLYYTNKNTSPVQWYNCDSNSVIQGATDSIYTPTVNGLYALIYDDDGCLDTTLCHRVAWLGLTNEESPERIKIYPNPANEFIRIESSLNDQIEISIYNLTGGLLVNVDKTGKAHMIKISEFPAGNFVMVIRSEGYIERKMFSIQR